MPERIKPYMERLRGLTDTLEEHENKRQKVMEFMKLAPCICFMKDCETGKYEFVNKKFCLIVGLDELSILGKTDIDLFSVEIAQRSVASDLEVIKTRKTAIVISKFEGTLYIVAKFLIVNGGESIGGFGLELPETFVLKDFKEEGPNAA